ncbi:MAG: TRAFs-binding domain-containing protein [Pseudomonadota bacterium]
MAQRPTAQALALLLGELDRTVDAAGMAALLSRAHAVADWSAAPQARVAFVRRLIRRGLSRDALELLPPAASGRVDPGIEQLRAWALANTGSPRAAAEILERLLRQGHEDAETLGLLGRTEKDRARRARSQAQATTHWRAALAHYQQAFERTGETYPGINAAALALRLGRREDARILAQAVLDQLDAQERAAVPDDEWRLATRAEALLILERPEEAVSCYARSAAVVVARRDWNALGSTMRQARELLDDLSLPPTLLEAAFPLPAIMVFSGHRIDGPDRAQSRFPQAQEQAVRGWIDAVLERRNVQIGYGSGANGADLLFFEALLARGGEAHLVLPMEVDSFIACSVREGHDDRWVARFSAVLAAASSVTVASDGVDPTDASAFEFCNRVLLGFARLKARELGAPLAGLAVWDGAPGAPGGTADCVALWARHELPFEQLHPRHGSMTPAVPAAPAAGVRKRVLMGMVFADIVGYSRLNEPDIERFYLEVLPQLGELCQAREAPPLLAQSFGDAFYFVLDSARGAAEFALEVNALFRERLAKFTALDLKIRIALHAGPLLVCHDPISQRTNYTGRHTSKAARVEPVAPENQVLTTQQFAALLALEGEQGYDLAYAGEQVLPKGYGSERLYLLSRERDSV